MEEKISVIVPIYKVEKYLHKCVDSIINQTYKNLEIILVDDGSPDNCPAICDEYAKKDNRIKVIHKPNGGLSDARNAGLDIATGEYIAFVDSDDYIDLTMYEKLYNAIKQNDCDLAVCGFNNVNEDESKVWQCWKKDKVINQNEPVKLLFENNNVGGIITAWNKLYHKDIFKTLRYPVGKINEDEFVVYDVLKNVKKGVVVIDNLLYFYRQRDNSIMNSRPTKKLLDGIEAAKLRVDKVGENSPYYQEATMQYLSSFYNVYKRAQGNKELQNEIHTLFIPEYKKYKKYMNLKRKLKYFLFRYFKIAVR